MKIMQSLLIRQLGEDK